MKLIVFLSLVLCLSAVAQPNPINRRAMAIVGLVTTNPVDITTFPVLRDGIFLRWRVKDLPASGSVVTWIDEIQGLNNGQGDPAKQPTITGSGLTKAVTFDGSTQYLTNAAIAIPSIRAMLLVLNLNTSGTAFGGVLQHDASGTPSDTTGFYVGGASQDVILRNLAGNSTAETLSLGTSYHGDFFYILGAQPYTNAIATQKGGDAGSTFTLDITGDGSAHDAKYKGKIQEIVWWTNSDFTLWDSTVRSNMHYYVTNTYSGISP